MNSTITQKQLDSLSHIPDAEVRKDIADTKREIRYLEKEMNVCQGKIIERQRLIDRLNNLLKARKDNEMVL